MVERRVVPDVAEAVVELFLAAAPRTIALSGGHTPKATYERLAAERTYSWSDVDVFFGDERCVPPDDPDSNFRMANETLLSHVPARGHSMSDCDPDGYEHELAAVFGPGIPSFDLMFLGLGEDGHTCSLFPGDPALSVTDRNAIMVNRPDHRRMTLTYPVVNAAKLAVFLVEGASKREPLAKLMAGADIPAALVASKRVVVLCDDAAAG
jgi:6-phosphogluconolactonase